MNASSIPFSLRIFASCAFLLSGCGLTPKVPDEVKVPVPVPCIAAEDRPARPQFMSDAELLALDRYRRTRALWGDRAEREGYQAKLEAVVEGCSKLPAVKR